MRRQWTEADLVRRFDAQGNSPENWRRQGAELLSTSRRLMDLWEDAISYDPPWPLEALDYSGPAVMLRGMAFECLLKARALDRGMVQAKEGRYVRIKGVRDHDLVGLARAVAFDLSPKEAAVLRGLSRQIIGGRYPIHREWREHSKIRPDGLLQPLMGWNPYLDDVFDELVGRAVEGWAWPVRSKDHIKEIMRDLGLNAAS